MYRLWIIVNLILTPSMFFLHESNLQPVKTIKIIFVVPIELSVILAKTYPSWHPLIDIKNYK